MVSVFLLSLALSLQGAQKDNRPVNRAEPASANQRGSDSLPVSVKLLNTGESEDDAKREAQKIREDRLNAGRNLGLTVALVGATILTLGVLLYQSIWLKRSVVSTEQNNRIALRAYVHAFQINITSASAKVTLKNLGQTPAHNVRTWHQAYHCAKENWRPNPNPTWSNQQLSLGRDSVIHQASDVPSLTPHARARIAAGDVAVILFNGGIKYTDVFGDTWETEYCFHVAVNDLESGIIVLTDGRNKAT